jgi:predicted MFS family arabinose efflux permease
VLVVVLIVFGMVTLGMVYGTWLGEEYGLTPAQLGLVALILGVADLSAVVAVSTLGDRIGKRRFVLVSVACSVIAYLLLPVLNVHLYAAVVGLILTRITFEAGMVGNISLLSEQIPLQRAKVLTVASAAVTIGVASGNLVGPSTYSTWGISAIGLISACSALLATIIVFRWVKEDEA